MHDNHDFPFGAYSITDYIRFVNVRDNEHAKEQMKARGEGKHVR